MSILPAVAGALAVNKQNKATHLTNQAIRITGIIAIPCGVFLFVAGRSCISLIYGAEKWSNPLAMANGTELLPINASADSLKILAVAVFFISVVSICNALLNAYGKAHLPFAAVLVGIVVLIASEVILLKQIGIYGAPASSAICYLIVMILDVWFMRKYCGVKLNFLKLFARPLLSGAVTLGVTYLVFKGSTYLWLNFVGTADDTRVASFAILMCSGIAMVVTYAATLLLFRGISEDEVRLLPMGNKIADILVKKGILARSAEVEE